MTPRVLVGLVALSLSFASAQTTERPLMVKPPQMQTAETQTPQVQPPQVAPSLPAAAPVAVPVSSGPVNRAVERASFRPVRLQVVNAGLVRQALGQQSGGLVIRPRAAAPLNPLHLPSSLASTW